ncbi:hypothetical protein MNBD_ALPHA01-2452 [hydrothermal vent metagenome]|uniref:HTH arsR-type domain-containing protein n=1 Tax=hydrothermal vent metagenome TaxID=652676 RepID=A0A3B0S7N4_9ZZZZ
MADLFNTLSSGVRREIISLLKDKDLTAGEIADRLDVTKPTLSGHFNVLKSADLIIAERSGTTITYSLNTTVAEELLASLVGLLTSKEKDKG